MFAGFVCAYVEVFVAFSLEALFLHRGQDSQSHRASGGIVPLT